MELANFLIECLIALLVAISVYLERQNLRASNSTQQALTRLFEARERWYSSRNRRAPARQEAEVEAVHELAQEVAGNETGPVGPGPEVIENLNRID